MEKALRPAPLDVLARWIFGELDARDTVLGIPKQNLAVPDGRLASRMFGRPLAAPLGVAAGPHTQLAQNIVASWLCGARFIELKTVQILDEIAVSRPCIDAADEAYNCEWSQELKLEQSFDEYLGAWVLVHALAHRLGLPDPGAHFAMSVGYDLAGIQSARVQRFIASMRDASAALPAAIDAVAAVYPAVRDLDIPSRISDHVTLSTMHGCPPAEIERIARYLLADLGVHTWVKLNPTLLGPDRLRTILNRTLGFDIEVPDAAFEHDPRFDDAMAMVRNLARAAEGRPQTFGVKLSNTLEVVNRRPVFPASEKMMYMSGRSLHPLTLTLAQRVTEELDGTVPISFCGGADAENFPDLVADGLSPITVCTDLLKPGGYARLQQYLANLDAAMARAGAESLEGFVHATSGGRGARENLARHAASVAKDPRYARRARPLAFKGERALGHFDCIAAPCQEACPAHQNIPDYLWLVARGQPTAALDVILRTNAQPGVTGSVCDHPCTERCVRNFYDAPLAIREVKRFAFEAGEARPERPGPAKGVKVAIVGAGPAGLAAAYYLARMGFEPVVLDAAQRAGGMVSGVIPGYRLSGHAIGNDLDRLRQLGVEFRLGTALGRDVSLAALREAYPYVFLAVGAQKGKRLGIPGEDARGVVDALELLDGVRAGTPAELGRRVLVVGGGNSAMDAARSARRLVKEGEVSLVYRRTRAEMPADPAEVHDCLAEGVGLHDLLAPVRVVVEGGRAVGLACARMKLGPPDASGRRAPVPAEGPEVVLPADAIVPAIGQEPVLDFLDGLALQRNRDGTISVDRATRETSVAGLFAGGDVVRGAASVIKAIADGGAVAREIGRRHGVEPEVEPRLEKHASPAALLEKKSRQALPQTVPVLPVPERGGFAEVIQSFGPEAAAAEASRCLDCDDLCSLCVTVCPNRANHAYATEALDLALPSWVVKGGALVAAEPTPFKVAQQVQILNIGDLCNECGNCETFCPTAGAPYQDKPRFWLDAEGYAAARGDAFRLRRTDGGVVIDARLGGRTHRLERGGGAAEYRSDRLVARFDPGSWSLLGVEPAGPLTEGESIDLSACATLIALLAAAPALPA
ncbi:MAG: putative selenate reductase subunit YgfK [Anaeromyxobacteraceae bacterium]